MAADIRALIEGVRRTYVETYPLWDAYKDQTPNAPQPVYWATGGMAHTLVMLYLHERTAAERIMPDVVKRLDKIVEAQQQPTLPVDDVRWLPRCPCGWQGPGTVTTEEAQAWCNKHWQDTHAQSTDHTQTPYIAQKED